MRMRRGILFGLILNLFFTPKWIIQILIINWFLHNRDVPFWKDDFINVLNEILNPLIGFIKYTINIWGKLFEQKMMGIFIFFLNDHTIIFGRNIFLHKVFFNLFYHLFHFLT